MKMEEKCVVEDKSNRIKESHRKKLKKMISKSKLTKAKTKAERDRRQ